LEEFPLKEDENLNHLSYCPKCSHAIYDSKLYSWETNSGKEKRELFKTVPRMIPSINEI
jgi:hypothetical protein